MSLPDFAPPKFDAISQDQMWRAYRPRVIDILDQVAAEETWVPPADQDIDEKLSDLVTTIANNDRLATQDECKRLCFCLAGVNVKQCIYALTWLSRRRSVAAESVVKYAHEFRQTNPYAGAVWQRLQSVHKSHLVDDLLALAKMNGAKS